MTVTLRDPRIYTFAKVRSTDGRALPGAVLAVVDSSGNQIIPSWTSSGSPYQFVNSDDNGNPILKSGIAYRLVEISAPAGYRLNTTGVAFQLDTNGLINGGTTVSMSNTRYTTPTDDTINLTFARHGWITATPATPDPRTGLVVRIYRKLVTGKELFDPYS